MLLGGLAAAAADVIPFALRLGLARHPADSALVACWFGNDIVWRGNQTDLADDVLLRAAEPHHHL